MLIFITCALVRHAPTGKVISYNYDRQKNAAEISQNICVRRNIFVCRHIPVADHFSIYISSQKRAMGRDKILAVLKGPRCGQ